MLGQCLITLGTTGIHKILIDEIILSENYYRLPAFIALFIAAFLVFLVLYMSVAHYIYLNRMDTKYLIAKKLMEAILRLPQAAFQEERTGTYVYHMTRDADNIAAVLSNRIPRGMQHVFYVGSIFFILGQMGTTILIVCTALIIVYFVLGKLTAPLVKRVSKEVNEERTKLTVIIEEGISSTREVLSYNRQDWEESRYNTRFKRYFNRVTEEGKKANLQLLLSEPMKWGTNVAVLAIGGFAVLDGKISLGTFLISYLFLAQLINSFQNLFNFSMDITRGLASADKLRRVMERAQTHKGTVRLESRISRLTFEQVTFSYYKEQSPVLDELCITIPAGKKVAFVGMSGGGKSTIAQLLVRFIEPDQGRILADGVPLDELETDNWMKRLAFVTQDPYFFPNTIRENIALGHAAGEDQIKAVCELAHIHSTIMDMPNEYDSVLGERGITLSGGQRQRLALARALLRDPEILILDEATSALDLETERQIMRMLDSARAGKTTLIIAHRLSTIRNADIIYVLDRGRIVGSGAYDELIRTCDVFHRLVQLDEKHEVGAAG
jgi:ABC-type multidrug transport system fused ATPase/permease subunit